MPMYPYKCSCSHEFDVLGKPSTIDSIAVECPKCNNKLNAKHRLISTRGYFTGAKVEDAAFCPAMGCVVRNSKHRREIAKRRGLEEIGNEKPETIARHFDEKQAEIEKKQEAQRYDDVMGALQ